MINKIAIIGFKGFIGSNLIRFFKNKRIHLKKINKIIQIEKSYVFKKAGLINCAAYNPSREIKNLSYRNYFYNNLKIILNILELALKKKIKYIIFLSSILAKTKNNEFNSLLKKIEEKIYYFYSSQLGIKLIVVRVPNIYSLHSKKKTIFDKLSKKKRGAYVRFSNYNSKISPLFVDDLSLILYNIVRNPKKYFGKIVEISNLKKITISEILQLLKRKQTGLKLFRIKLIEKKKDQISKLIKYL